MSKSQDLRQVYLKNREAMLEQFAENLKEIQLDAPSVEGKIAGMDFQQFSAYTVILSIVKQEEYIEYAKKHSIYYVNLAEEQSILERMITEAKQVLGDQYEEHYNSVNNES